MGALINDLSPSRHACDSTGISEGTALHAWVWQPLHPALSMPGVFAQVWHYTRGLAFAAKVRAAGGTAAEVQLVADEQAGFEVRHALYIPVWWLAPAPC
jgi:hypothetical protein